MDNLSLDPLNSNPIDLIILCTTEHLFVIPFHSLDHEIPSLLLSSRHCDHCKESEETTYDLFRVNLFSCACETLISLSFRLNWISIIILAKTTTTPSPTTPNMPEFLAHASDTAKKDYVDIATNDNIVKATKEKVDSIPSIRLTIFSLGSSCMGST